MLANICPNPCPNPRFKTYYLNESGFCLEHALEVAMYLVLCPNLASIL